MAQVCIVTPRTGPVYQRMGRRRGQDTKGYDRVSARSRGKLLQQVNVAAAHAAEDDVGVVGKSMRESGTDG